MNIPGKIKGDGPCQDCAGDNIIWFTDSNLWNFVLGGPEARDDPGGLLCVRCFVVRVDAAGLAPYGWRLIPEWHWETESERACRTGREVAR